MIGHWAQDWLTSRARGFLSRVSAKLCAVAKDRGGATAVLVGATIIPIVGVTGLAIDTTRGYMLRAQLSHAVDAAGLAGGKQLFADDMDAIVQRFFDANFPDGYMGATITGPTTAVDSHACVAILANLSTLRIFLSIHM